MSNNPQGNYALGASYDAGQDGIYSAAPIGGFGGNFEGLGNTISNLTINDPTNGDRVGLFFEAGGRLADVGFLRANIIGSGLNSLVGTLVAYDIGGVISGVYATGRVVSGKDSHIGGLVGDGHSVSLQVTNSHAGVMVSGPSGNLGGLIGVMDGSIDSSYATGKVTASGANSHSNAGGLVGSGVAISDSWATGDVSSKDAFTSAGGLAGFGNGVTENSYATGTVSINGQAGYAGGLVGEDSGTIANAFATGNVSIVAHEKAQGFAAVARAGGLVALEENVISNAYAMGNVSGISTYKNATAVVGGLIGDMEGTDLSDSYSAGMPSGSTSYYLGGSIGLNGNENVANFYWDTTTAGSLPGVGTGPSNGISGLTTQQFQSGLPAGFDPNIWGSSQNINNGYPYLLTNPPQ